MVLNGDLKYVDQFYEGAQVLVTGATGFLAGVLLQKLLEEKVEKIYVLIREKRGKTPEERLQKVLSSPLFQNHLKEDVLQKVVPLAGDLTLPGLGLDSKSLGLLENISIVFHAAASINFNASLYSAITINLIGTYEVWKVCKSFKHLKCLVYISTAYCNVDAPGSKIEEKIYPSEFNYRYIMEFARTSTREEVDMTTKRLLGVHPNTYTFTKQLAENMIANESENLCVAIVRPPIVLGTWKLPMAGWVDNVNNGALATIAGSMKGIFRYANLQDNLRADFMPADLVANLIMTCAWDVANQRKGTVRVFHLSSSELNPITWGEYSRYVTDYIQAIPSEEIIWFPKLQLRKSNIHFLICYFLWHLLPAAFYDLLLVICNKKPLLVNIQKKYLKGSKHVSFFTYREWEFDMTNSLELANRLSLMDEQHKYNFDITEVNWNQFMENTVYGLKYFYFKENPKKIEKCQKKLSILKFIHLGSYLISFLFIFLIFNLFNYNIVHSSAISFTIIFILWLI